MMRNEKLMILLQQTDRNRTKPGSNRRKKQPICGIRLPSKLITQSINGVADKHSHQVLYKAEVDVCMDR